MSTTAKVRGSVITYVIRFFLSAVMGVVIARALAPEGRGEYAVVVLIASVATVLGHLSVGNANVSFWSTHRDAIPANNFLVGPPLGLASATIVGLAVYALGPRVLPVPNWWLLILALATVPAAVTIVQITTVTLLLGRVDRVNRSLTLAAVVQCASLLAFGALGALSPAVVIWVWGIAGVLPLVLLFPTLRPQLRRPDSALAVRMIVEGLQYHVGLVALFLVLRIDVFVLNALVPLTAVGLYTLSVSLGEMTYAGTEALSQALLPRQAESELTAAGTLTARTTRVGFIVALCSVGAICLVAPVLVPVLYGQAFRGSVPPLFALAPGLVFYGATRAIAPYLMRLGRPRVMSALSVIALAVNVGLNLLLTPRLGIVGCALATSAGYVTLAAAQMAWFVRSAGLPAAALLPRREDAAVILEAARRQTYGATART